MGTRSVLGFVVFSVVFSVGLFAPQAMGQNLRFNPDPYVPVDEVFSVPLVLEAGGLDIKGVEATITFDPSLVYLDSITPGPWFTNSTQNYFFWDYTTPYTYAIHFASAMLDGTNNIDDTIAYCHFSVVDFGICPLDFTLVDVRDVSNVTISFDVDPGVIILNAAVDTETVKFSTLKAIYR